MSRAIKFRAWNKDHKKMIDLLKITPLALNRDMRGIFIPFDDNVIVMQFTGLHDRNGKEIFEWDIVRYMPNFYNSLHVIEPGLRISARLIKKGSSHWPPQYLDAMLPSSDIEIIGNQLEHPELLSATPTHEARHE